MLYIQQKFFFNRLLTQIKIIMKTKHLLTGLFLSVAISTSAANYVVTSNSVDAAVEGSLLNVMSKVASGDVISFNFDGTEINSPSGSAYVILDAKSITINGINAANNKPVEFKGPEVIFEMKGGAILNLNNVVVSGKTGIPFKLSANARLNAKQCKFLNNGKIDNTNNGGLVRISSAIGDFEDCYFEGNACGGSYGGGALCAYGKSSLYVKKCTFVNNHSSNGGAIVIQGTTGNIFGDCRIENSTFVNNGADGVGDQRGGAIYVKNGGDANSNVKPIIIYNTFVGNVAYQAGGAIDCFAMSGKFIEITMINNLMAGNIHGDNFTDNDVHIWNLVERVTTKTNNNVFAAATTDAFTISDTNVNFASDVVFKSLVPHPSPDFLGTDKKTAQLYTDANGRIVAMIDVNSVAKGKAVATSSSIANFPTTDQLGATRPASPSVGAVEYAEGLTPLGLANGIINQNTPGANVKAWIVGKQLFVSGVEGSAAASVYDLTGKEICNGTIDNNSPISVNQVCKGVYVVKINNKSTSEAIKLVVD